MTAQAPISERLLAGERGALARLITWAENADPRFAQALAKIYGRVGRGYRVGITGPPGAGKSTIVNALATHLRAQGLTVAILAVDPSSPFTGGALLGDRIRMEERTSDPGVFIRSMASRGSHGGIARATVDACDVMDAFGFDVLLVETVGVGQAEFDVVSAADTVVVVSCPGAGDGVQAMKAGLLEVADVLCVNKVDRPGADSLLSDLEEAVHVRFFPAGQQQPRWTAPVVGCTAVERKGLDDLWAAVQGHRAFLEGTGLDAARAAKRVEQVKRVVGERLEEEIWGPGGFSERVESELRAARTPYDVASDLLADLRGHTLGTSDAQQAQPGSPDLGDSKREATCS